MTANDTNRISTHWSLDAMLGALIGIGGSILILIFGVPGTSLAGGLAGVIERLQSAWVPWGGWWPVVTTIALGWLVFLGYLVLVWFQPRWSLGRRWLAAGNGAGWLNRIFSPPSSQAIGLLLLALSVFWGWQSIDAASGLALNAAGYERARIAAANLPGGSSSIPRIAEDERGKAHETWSQSLMDVTPGWSYGKFTIDDAGGASSIWQLHNYRRRELGGEIAQQLVGTQGVDLSGLGDAAWRLQDSSVVRIVVVDGESVLVGETSLGSDEALETTAELLLAALPGARVETAPAFDLGSWLQGTQTRVGDSR